MFGTEETKKLVKAISLFLIIISVFFVIKLIGEIKSQRFIGSGTTATNTITISGEGRAFAVPDIATITFSVRQDAPTVKEAQEKANEIANSAIAFVRDSGVEEKDIKVVSNNFYPKYENVAPCYTYPCPNKEPKIIGYEVSRSITVKVRNADSAGDIVDGLTTKNVTDLSGPTFTIDDEDAIQEEARMEAIKDAREKAEKLANQLGVSIIRVVGFNESTGGAYPMMYSRPESANYGMGGADMDVKVSSDLPVGENEYSSYVTITYEIR